MIFISLMKFRQKPTKELFAENLKFMEKEKKEGIKNLGIYWTLGRFDAVVIMEAPNEKIVMKSLMRMGWAASQPLVAIPAVEARKFVE